jgi:hypothetical protein
MHNTVVQDVQGSALKYFNVLIKIDRQMGGRCCIQFQQESEEERTLGCGHIQHSVVIHITFLSSKHNSQYYSHWRNKRNGGQVVREKVKKLACAVKRVVYHQDYIQ